MKNLLPLITALVLTLTLSLQACADPKTIDGVTYDTYGFINADEKRNPDVEYHLVVGNVVWGILLCESIVFPIYFFGFSIYEPIGRKGHTVKGAVTP